MCSLFDIKRTNTDSNFD
uniref:Uncharacterized protein n=1 Tax=Arundo donax TaxID=35708 RepID=A0A0A9HGJ0_ARUDO